MSKLFHEVQSADFRFGWTEWILNYVCKEDAWIIFRNVYILSDNIDLIDEIWDRIVHKMVSRTLCLKKRDSIFKWMIKWTSSVIDGTFNPMKFEPIIKNFIDFNYNKPYDQRAALFNTGICHSICLPAFGDYIMGIKIDENTKNIKSCDLYFNTVKFDYPFIFQDTYKSFVLDDCGNKMYYYYHPVFKVIPMYLLGFTTIKFEFEFIDNRLDQNFDILYGFCNREVRNAEITAEKNPICIKPHSTDKTFVIYQGQAGYLNY